MTSSMHSSSNPDCSSPASDNTVPVISNPSFPYADIINLPRPHAKSPMDIDARAAQFAPYAALSGHQDLIHSNEISAEATETREIININID